MDQYDRIIHIALSLSFVDPATLRAIQHYVHTGDVSELTVLRRPTVVLGWYPAQDLADKLPAPAELDEIDERMVNALTAVCSDVLGSWLDKYLQKEKTDENLVQLLADVLGRAGFARQDVTNVVRFVGHYRSGSFINSAGRWILSVSDDELGSIVSGPWPIRTNVMLVTLLAQECPRRLAEYVSQIIYDSHNYADIGLAEVLLTESNGALEQEISQVFEKERRPYTRFHLGSVLAARNPTYLDATLAAARASLAERYADSSHAHICEWMIDTYATDVVAEIADYIGRTLAASFGGGSAKESVVEHAASRLGREALPILLAGIRAPDLKTRLAAVTQLAALDDGAHAGIILNALEQGLANDATDVVIGFIGVAARWNVAAVADTLWKLAIGKSRPVRIAAAKALSTAGAAVIARALELLNDRKADSRTSAVTVIASVGDPEALRAVENAVESEDKDDVREEMLAALQESWQEIGRQLPIEFVERRAERMAAEGWRAPFWMSKIDFPQMRYRDGREVPLATAIYVLMRQQKLGEMRSPIELLSFYGHIDRNTTADFALAILNGFVGSGASANDKWALVAATLLGDDRIVPVLHTHVRKWAESGRGKLAEYAVEALALLTSDRALLAIDSLALRYRTKMKNVGAAAVQAFASAAKSLGVTVDELGDRVVPDLGFGSSRSRVIDCGGKKVEVRLGLDLKLSYADLQKNKKIASLPSSTPEAVKAEFKDLGALLRDLAKSQSRRLESLMVHQRRWTAQEWQRLFLRHPLMIPFGVRLIWGQYTETGEIAGMFRALEDGTLVSQSSDFVQIDGDDVIGLVHPLELDESSWLRWKEHLDNYQVTPPFPQLDRPVVQAEPEQADTVFCTSFENYEMNGMTFKGRAERLGWARGSVCDAGGITAYAKRYPAARVDAFVMLQGMYVGLDMYSDIKIGQAFFVPHGTVKIGSYEYDEPDSDKDPRLIPFGQVPRLVYSETIGDLQNITRPSKQESEE